MEEAEFILSQAQLTSDLTEVLYQYGIMAERMLGSDNPYFIELLCMSITFDLEQAHPSKAVVHMFPCGIELFNLFLISGKQESYSFELVSPVRYFDKLMEKGLASFLLKLLTDTLKLLRKTEIQVNIIWN